MPSKKKRKGLPPLQVRLELMEGAKVLVSTTINTDDRVLLARILYEMAEGIENAASECELEAADLRTIFKLLPS